MHKVTCSDLVSSSCRVCRPLQEKYACLAQSYLQQPLRQARGCTLPTSRRAPCHCPHLDLLLVARQAEEVVLLATLLARAPVDGAVFLSIQVPLVLHSTARVSAIMMQLQIATQMHAYSSCYALTLASASPWTLYSSQSTQ